MNDTAVKTVSALSQLTFHRGMSQMNSKKRNRTFQVILCYKKSKQGSVVEDLISRKEHSSEFTEHVLYVFVEL